MKTTLGAPSGARGGSNGDQSGTESRMSTLTTPPKDLVITCLLEGRKVLESNCRTPPLGVGARRGCHSDASATAPGGDGGCDDSCLGNRRWAWRHGLGDDRGFRDGVPHDSYSSDSCCSQWHVRLLLSRVPRPPRWRR